MNGHGGNNFKQMIRELYAYFPDVFVCTLDWYKAANWNLYFDEPGDHAGEMETSVIMKVAPQWALPLSEAGDGKEKKFNIKGLREGWVSSQRLWTAITADTGVGNPHKATPEKAERYLAAVTKNIADFLIELEKCPLSELYEK